MSGGHPTTDKQTYCQEKRHGMYVRNSVCGELTVREVDGVRYCEPHAKRAELDAANKAAYHGDIDGDLEGWW